MKNKNELEKSKTSKGIVIFAYDSGFEYVKIANMAGALAKKYLGLSVTLITDSNGIEQCDSEVFDNVIVTESPTGNKRTFRQEHGDATIVWKNFTRFDVYELTPYDQTILIDCDYFINSNQLLKLFETTSDFLCHNVPFDLANQKSFKYDAVISENCNIPMLWATVIYFTKSEYAESIFSTMKMIKDNYKFYAAMYGFNITPYRNDYALSIAHHLMNGYNTHSQYIPWDLISLPQGINHISNLYTRLRYYYNSASYSSVTDSLDLHIMNKKTLIPYYDTVMTYAKS